MELVFLLVMLTASAYTSREVWLRRGPDQPMLPVEPRRAASWGLADLILITVLLGISSKAIFDWLAARYGVDVSNEIADVSPRDQTMRLSGGAVVELIVFIVSLATVALRDRTVLRRIGISRDTIGRDLKIGSVAFLMLAGPTYLLQTLLTLLFPSEHPVAEVFQSAPSAWLFGVLSLVAVIAAPIFEEYVFRMILQGSLENLFDTNGDVPRILLGKPVTFAVPSADDTSPDASTATRHDKPLDENDLAPHNSPAAESFAVHDSHSVPESDASRNVPWWPIVISALIFALLHLSHGPDPIPLFLLALGLGYVYRATNRLLPCIVVHLLLNACSMLLMLVGTWLGK